jgi:LuxR family maltose regulon positive regulatory protein
VAAGLVARPAHATAAGAGGGEAVPAAAARSAASGLAGRSAAGAAGELSARELEVLALIAAGDSNKVIARALDLSPHTVKRHVANILDKLALASRGQAAAWYRDRR